MTVHNRVKKGDIVALTITKSATYAFGTGRGTERRIVWTLARVNGANRAGEATSIVRAMGTVLHLRRKDYALTDIRTIGPPNQDKAKALFKTMTWKTDEYDSKSTLQNAIRNARP